MYCNELDHFLELSTHLFGKLRLYCPELFLFISVRRCTAAEKRELESSALWTRVLDCMWKIVSIETRWYGTSVPDLNLAQWSEFSLIVSVVSAWLYVWSRDRFWAWYHVSSTCTSHSSNFRKKLKNPKIVEKDSSLKLEAIISYGRLFFWLVWLTKRAVLFCTQYDW